MKKKDLCQLLAIDFPLLQGGMAWVADARLAAAVSNAGALGLVGSGSMDAGLLRREIHLVKEKTSRPFGVNIMLLNPHAADLARVVIEEEVPVVTTGAGSPGKFMPDWLAAGIKVIPVVASVAYAKRMASLGAAAVVAEGTEAGGHIGEATTMVLVPQIADAVDIPVIAAGGIADGRGVAAAFMLGADGIQLGTRFLVCHECGIHENYKQMVLKARDIDTQVTGRSGGHPVRALRNKLARRLLELEKEGATFAEIESITAGSLQKAVKYGDLEEGSFMAGQSAGLVQQCQSAEQIVHSLFTDAAELFQGRLPVAAPGLEKIKAKGGITL